MRTQWLLWVLMLLLLLVLLHGSSRQTCAHAHLLLLWRMLLLFDLTNLFLPVNPLRATAPQYWQLQQDTASHRDHAGFTER